MNPGSLSVGSTEEGETRRSKDLLPGGDRARGTDTRGHRPEGYTVRKRVNQQEKQTF